MTFENGKTLTINAPKNSAENVYVNALQMNGSEYDKNWLSHKAMQQGGTLNFDMTAKPNYTRGASKNAAPYSMTTELQPTIKLKSNKKK